MTHLPVELTDVELDVVCGGLHRGIGGLVVVAINDVVDIGTVEVNIGDVLSNNDVDVNVDISRVAVAVLGIARA